MGRPTDWHALDLDKDPVPGDPYEVRTLAKTLGDFADDVDAALRSIRGLAGDSVLLGWIGLSGDAFRQQYGDLPKDLDKLENSYRLASGALGDYWPQLEHAQAQADKALSDAQDAQQQLASANSQLSSASDWVSRANTTSQQYQQTPKPNTPPPDPQQVQDAAKDAANAAQAKSSAQEGVNSAQDKLNAAKQLAADAASLRDNAANTCSHALGEASDAGIHNKTFWQKLGDFIVHAWHEIVAICKIVVAVLGVIVMIIGGPLAWVVVAAAAVVLVDTVIQCAQGKASFLDVAFAALGCIPGLKGLTTIGGLAKMAKTAPELLRSGKALENTANGIRNAGDFLKDMRGSAVSMAKRTKCGDPVDVVTGDLVMSATDVELPGVLPLVLERHHISSYRGGRLFGRSWASTLDQRLLVDDQGVRFVTADGMILYYPVPRPGAPVMPLEGPRWPLDWHLPSGEMTVGRPDTGQTLHFSALPGLNPANLPLAAITDAWDNRVTVGHDARGVPSQVAHSGGYRVGVESDGRRVTALRLLSHEDRPVLLSYGYDTAGDLTEVTNSSRSPMRFGYDTRHRITSWQDRNGTGYRYEYDDQGRCVFTTGTGRFLEYSYRYDEAGRRTTATNSLGQRTVYEFNDRFQLVAETDPLGNTTVREWDPYDRLQAVTDPLGLTTRYEYDGQGNPVAVIRPDGSRTTAENGESGRPVTVTRADGNVWHMEYDSHGNLVTETDPTGATLSYRYDSAGSCTSVTDAAGRTVLIDTDASGMPVASTDAEGATTRYERDAFGRVVARTGPDGAATRFEWTAEGRLSLRTLPDGGVERRAYDGEGNLVEHVDAAGGTTRFEYTAFDRPSARTDPDGSRLEFGYDTELRISSVTGQLGSSWRYFYDEAGRLAREEDFGGRTRSYRHDAAGRLVEQTNGAGESTAYVRNALGKVVEQRTPEGVTTFAYDPVGNVLRVSGDHAELSYERDALGRVTAETCNGATVRSAYDVLGRRTRRVTPSDAESVWEYDGRDRPVLLRTAGRTVTFAYDEAGREVERRAGAAVLSQAWDPNGRMSSQTLSARDLSGEVEPRAVQRRAYHYRPDGTLGAVDDLVHGGRVFDVDPVGRVTGVRAETWSESYAYDPAGNLAQGQWSASTPGAEPADGPGDVRYDTDAQGRVVRRRRKRLSRKPDVWQYTWDSQDRLVGVITPDGTRWAYRYDPFGRRIAKERFGPDGETVVERVLFAWDGFVLAEQATLAGDDAPRCVVWNWERDRFSPVTQVERLATRDQPQEWIDEQFYSIVTDVVGTPAELVDDQGELAWQARTTLWGAHLGAAEAGRAHCPLRFPGQYHDPESALNYNYHRHYDPETGQYTSLDPLGLAPGPNPRAYVRNPFTAVDPLGLAPDCERALETARARGDLEQGSHASQKTRPTCSVGLAVPGHDTVFEGASIKGGGDHDLHPTVQAAYDRVPEGQRAPGNQHGRCGEPEALSNAYRAGVDPKGGTIAATEIRAAGNPKHGAVKAPCSSCQHVLDDLGIAAVE